MDELIDRYEAIWAPLKYVGFMGAWNKKHTGNCYAPREDFGHIFYHTVKGIKHGKFVLEWDREEFETEIDKGFHHKWKEYGEQIQYNNGETK